MPIRILRADIVTLPVDAIVNAANETLLGGGGVDGAIHAAAGPGLLDECRSLGGCKTGHAKLTGGHSLPARHVIHTVGPIYTPATAESAARSLAACYRRSLEIAHAAGLRSIAFPTISTGIYRYPLDEACAIATTTVRAWLRDHRDPLDVILVAFDERNERHLREALEEEESR